MTAFRKKPVVIEAVQLDGTEAAFQAAIAFLGGASGAFNGHLSVSDPDRSWLYIDTLEGQMTAHTGDWIIRGVKGEHYPCKPDIFALTYEAADALAECVEDAERWRAMRQAEFTGRIEHAFLHGDAFDRDAAIDSARNGA